MASSNVNSFDSPVHFAVTLRVRKGREAEFADALARFARRSLDYPGTTGVHLIQPVPGTGSHEFGILRSFASERHSQEFYASEMYQQYKSETAHLVEGEPIIRRLTGLEAFFRNGGHRLPPRWKMAIVTYLGVVPAALFWSTTLKPLLSDFHWFVGALLINAAVVVTLAWAMMPVLTRLFSRLVASSPMTADPYSPMNAQESKLKNERKRACDASRYDLA